MTTDGITLERADASTVDRVVSLLDACGLPTADVRATPAAFFLAYAAGECVGTGGLEAYGTDGLLRSVAIVDEKRGEGYGTALCEALEGEARASDVARLYLLTTSAAPFFRRRGYREIDRADAPARIRETTEFAELCPQSATCMAKTLRE
ncbi:arsenic resistance N-acetyltransferase ArsN2 [Halovivax limisalsi]|uniref:arsenic resistance N-acetyltransferase ArsN2 n=1 Tax=Halovivax limisalsi TaxID=1453760 RepID=UPI001FFDE1FD|nr:arsenic resistance N-acetyltransferase ArsN2 [Halovivax limisalsi]